MGRHEKAGWEFLVAQAHLERTTSYTETNTVLARRTGFRAFDFDLDSERNAMGELLEQLSLRSFNPTGNLLISVLVQFEQPLFEAAVAVAEVGLPVSPAEAACRKNSRTAASTQLTRRSPRTYPPARPAPPRGSATSARTGPAPEEPAATPGAPRAPVKTSVSEVAYVLVLDPVRSRPSRMCSKNPSAPRDTCPTSRLS